MAKKFISGDLTKPVTINQGGTWVLGGLKAITIAEDMMTTAGIELQSGIGNVELIVNGDISMGGVDHTCISVKSDKSQVSIGANSVITANNGIRTDAGLSESTITNAGQINCGQFGVVERAISSVFINESTGKVSGDYAILFAPQDPSDSIRIVNKGEISGSTNSFYADLGTVVIRNEGVINGDIALDFGDDRIINPASGTINGDIYLDFGNDVVNTRFGNINGQIHGGAGNDVFILKTIDTVVHELAGEGTDTIRIAADAFLGSNVENLTLLGKGNFQATGNLDANVLTGNRGANILLGIEGDDRLKGGRGNDTLSGGDGADIFVFNRNGDVDTIGDFTDGVDLIQLKGWKGINDFGDFSARISQVGADVVIRFGDGDKLVIDNCDAANLTSDDFLF